MGDAIATLSKRTQRLLIAYDRTLAAEPVGRAPIFRNRSGRAYSKDTLGDDFRTIRTMVFGESETRQLADFRRSGTVEALAGKVDPLQLSSKMANSFSTSNRLHKTYGPTRLSAVRAADAARKRGRGHIRADEGAFNEQRTDKSPRAPVQESQNAVHQRAKPLK